ncbi:hypothetical protein [Cellulophaga baltica]|uniref:hypothetical protein n=1 Tax=Cellulophaga baltica TaxID=76594 RepID=UPI0004668FEA|nr:hypothetical protein [Cellulophaga baltica]
MKSKYTNILFALLITSITTLTSCQSEYTKLVNKEMNTGIVYDSILLDLNFGDTKERFFNRCWELNKEKLVAQGPNNDYVKYAMPQKFEENSGKYLNMLFYAKFDNASTIKSFDLKFSYTGWAPWNKELYANELLPKICDTILKWYPGNKFINIDREGAPKLKVKVDGNRQITVFSEENTKDVSVLIEDLRIKMKNLK